MNHLSAVKIALCHNNIRFKCHLHRNSITIQNCTTLFLSMPLIKTACKYTFSTLHLNTSQQLNDKNLEKLQQTGKHIRFHLINFHKTDKLTILNLQNIIFNFQFKLMLKYPVHYRRPIMKSHLQFNTTTGNIFNAIKVNLSLQLHP